MASGLASIEDDPTWSWVYLGYSTDQDLYSDVPKHPGIFQFSASRFRTYGGGTFAYAIRKKGARALLQTARDDGVRQAIDWFMISHFSTLTVLKLVPQIVTTPPILSAGSDTNSAYPAEITLSKVRDHVAHVRSTLVRQMIRNPKRSMRAFRSWNLWLVLLSRAPLL